MAKILIVEDETQIARLLGKILAPFGKIELAHDGGSGYVKYLKNRHDIVICDVAMPVSNGLELAKKLRKISAEVPIIIISAHSETDKLLRAIDARVNKYLIKPINPDELIAAVREMLAASARCVQIGGAKIMLEQGKFCRSDGKCVDLMRRELQLLKELSTPVGRVLSVEEIKRMCWPDKAVQNGSVRTLIGRLRAKMGTDAWLLANRNNAGYLLSEEK